MRIAPNTNLNEHRLARLMTCARLSLVWLVGAFAGLAGELSRRRLDFAARILARLIFLHVAARVRPQRSGVHRHGRLRAIGSRAVVGAALRRALRGKDFATRLFALLRVMRDADHHIAKLARRLRRGLTRLRALPLLPEPGASIAPAPRASAMRADTS